MRTSVRGRWSRRAGAAVAAASIAALLGSGDVARTGGATVTLNHDGYDGPTGLATPNGIGGF